MPTVLDSGTKASTDIVIGTEYALVDSSLNKYFSGYIDLTNMASGDTLEVRAYIKIKSTGNTIQYDVFTTVGVQNSPLLFIPPMPSTIEYKLTIKQTAGTARSYDWIVFTQ